MLSIDTNVLVYAQNRDCTEYERARAFLADCRAITGSWRTRSK